MSQHAPRYRVVCTAGHVDHGKSRLVAALTGTHPDRLPEERRRDMSIDLGFAYLSLPPDLEVAFVDVPGHRDFIENMLAGVGGVHAALLVVAADEGVMPQTQEHLAILEMLQIPQGLVALTKIDLAPDAEWLEAVEEEVRDLLQGTFLQDAPLLRVSVQTGEGLPALRGALARLLQDVPPRPNTGRPRLAVDRVFARPGFGTVVTGTLIDGAWQVGDPVEVLPAEAAARIRGMQAHGRPIQQAQPGMRLALNLAGIPHHALQRGDVVAAPGAYRPTTRIDVHLRMWDRAPAPLPHMAWVKLFVWSAEVMARVRLLGRDALAPGEEAVAQLELTRPVVVAPGDRFILRRPSPDALLAGGRVLDPHPRFKYRKGDRKARERLQHLARMGQVGLWRRRLEAGEVLGEAEVTALLPAPEREAILAQALREGWLQRIDAGGRAFYVASTHWEQWQQRALAALRAFHQEHPARPGMPKATLRTHLGLEKPLFDALLQAMAAQGHIRVQGSVVALPDFRPHLPPGERERVQRILETLSREKPAHPVRVWMDALGAEVYTFLVAQGLLIPLEERAVVTRAQLEQWLQAVRELFARHGPLRVAQVRDALGLSRRLTVALLEYLDRQGYTRREGDLRVWLRKE